MEEKDTKKNASQGKGKGKNKKQTMDLNEFMASNPTQVGFTAVTTSRWSDVMDGDEEDESLFNKMNDTVVILPNAPKSIRGPDIDINQIPNEPPFICYLSNLPFEATEDDISKFFKNLKITRIELAKEPGSSGRMRGQGTCTFPDRKTLIDAFTCNKGTIKNREIKLSINSFETERENYRRDRYVDKEDRTGGDWRARKPDDKPISNFSSNQSYNESNYNRNRDRGDRDRDFNRFNGDSYGGSGNYNNRSNRMNRDYDKDKYPSQLQDSNKNRSQFLTNFLSKNVEIKQDYKNEDSEISEIDRQTKNIAINSNEPNYDNKYSEQRKEEEPRKERKKLVLLPPSKKENTEPSTPVINTSIFGEAKPVDTSKRLLEVETKLQEKVLENKEKESEKSSRENVSKSNYNKRLSDSGSQSGSSYRDNNYDNRSSGRYEEDRFSNNFRKGGNQNRRMNSGNRNYDSFNNRDNRDRDNYNNRDNRNMNKFNNNNSGYRNNTRDNDQSNKPVIKKEYDNRNRQNRNTGGNRMARGRNENIFSSNRYDLLEEADLD